MNSSKVAIVANAFLGKLASIIGYVGGAFSLLGAVALFSESDVGGGAFFLALLAFFVFLIIKGSQIKRRINRFKGYVSLISAQHMTSLDNIAASTGQSIDFVRNDLQKMINKKFFANASIDIATSTIIIGGMVSTPKPTVVMGRAQAAAQTEQEVFTCAGCGAMGTKAKGIPGVCEYCGAMAK